MLPVFASAQSPHPEDRYLTNHTCREGSSGWSCKTWRLPPRRVKTERFFPVEFCSWKLRPWNARLINFVPRTYFPIGTCRSTLFNHHEYFVMSPKQIQRAIVGMPQQSNTWVFPKIKDGLWWKTLLKWMIWGYHYFWIFVEASTYEMGVTPREFHALHQPSKLPPRKSARSFPPACRSPAPPQCSSNCGCFFQWWRMNTKMVGVHHLVGGFKFQPIWKICF